MVTFYGTRGVRPLQDLGFNLHQPQKELNIQEFLKVSQLNKSENVFPSLLGRKERPPKEHKMRFFTSLVWNRPSNSQKLTWRLFVPLTNFYGFNFPNFGLLPSHSNMINLDHQNRETSGTRNQNLVHQLQGQAAIMAGTKETQRYTLKPLPCIFLLRGQICTLPAVIFPRERPRPGSGSSWIWFLQHWFSSLVLVIFRTSCTISCVLKDTVRCPAGSPTT